MTEEQEAQVEDFKHTMKSLKWFIDYTNKLGLSSRAFKIMECIPNGHSFMSSGDVFLNLRSGAIESRKGKVALNGLCVDHPRERDDKRKIVSKQHVPCIVNICVQCTLKQQPFWQMYFVCNSCRHNHIHEHDE